MINKIDTTPDRNELISKLNQTIDVVNGCPTREEIILVQDRGVAYGVAPLDENSKVPIQNIKTNQNGGVAQLSSSGHLMMPDGSEIWVE